MLHAAWVILCQLAPWLLLGMLISGLLHGWLPAGFIHRRLRGRAGVFQAVAFGVPLPLCSCGVVPAGIGLKKDGASDGAAVGFLISTPQTGVDSILVSASFLGWPFAFFKVFSAALTGIVGGLLCDAFQKPSASNAEQDAATFAAARRDWRGMRDHALEILQTVWGWLVLGILASAAIEVYLPQSVFTQVAAWGSIASALIALGISLPLYVCATASVPIAAVLVRQGLPAGAALVFLMAGPATNVATIGAVYRVFGARTLAIYLGDIVIGSILCAVAFDWLLTAEAIQTVHQHERPAWWAVGSALIVLLLIVRFAVDDLRRMRRRFGRGRQAAASRPGYKVAVQGMTCNACVNRLEKALGDVDGVESTEVQLHPGQAIVYGSMDDRDIRAAIEAAGFEPQEASAV